MDRKELFDGCIKLAEYYAGRWDRRRDEEWKTTATVWTLAVVAIAFIREPGPELVAPIVVFILGYAFFWLKPVWETNEIDRVKARYYREEADAILRDSSYSLRPAPALPPNPRKYNDLGFLGNWSIRFQFVSVLVLAVLFFLVPRQ